MQKVFADLSKKLMDELTKFFRPELVNRFDGVVIFKPLRKQDMKLIAKINIGHTAKLLKEQGFNLEVSEKALEKLGDEGFDPVYGARPLRRLIQNAIENPISIQIIGQKFIVGDTVKIDYDDAKQEFTFLKSVTAPVASGTTPGESTATTQQPGVPPTNGVAQSVSQPTNSMITDPYTPVQNPMTPPPFNPFTANETSPASQMPTLGSDGTQMELLRQFQK